MKGRPVSDPETAKTVSLEGMACVTAPLLGLAPDEWNRVPEIVAALLDEVEGHRRRVKTVAGLLDELDRFRRERVETSTPAIDGPTTREVGT